MTTLEEQKIDMQEHSALSTSILEKIEKENVAPVPKWQFLLSEYAIWGAWAFSVLVGAVAFSVMLFVLMHSGFAVYEATHQDVLHFLMEVMPYLWILVFVAMGVLAHHNLKHTKRGYRYTLWQMLLSSILFSLIGGVVLHILGIGYLIDTQAGRSIPLYPGLEKMEARLWQSPKQGRLVGTLQSLDATGTSALFKDTEGVVWKLNTQELSPIDMLNLESGEKVRLLGLISETSDEEFHGCAVFPPVLQIESFGDIQKDRALFLERMNKHHMKALEELMASGTIPGVRALCANHNTVIRIQKSFAH